MPPDSTRSSTVFAHGAQKHNDTKFALMGGGVDVSNMEHPRSSDVENSAPRGGDSLGREPLSAGSNSQRGPSWRSDRDRLLNLLFKWKAAEAWREVVLICGAEAGCGGYRGLRSSCEVEVRKRLSEQSRAGQRWHLPE